MTTGQKICDDYEADIIAEPADLAQAIDAAIEAERERCAKIAEDQIKMFASNEYATQQPMSSFAERFACRTVAELIRAQSMEQAKGELG